MTVSPTASAGGRVACWFIHRMRRGQQGDTCCLVPMGHVYSWAQCNAQNVEIGPYTALFQWSQNPPELSVPLNMV